MICPSCGCQQRATDYCIQCRSPIISKGSDERSLSHSSEGALPRSGSESLSRVQPPRAIKRKEVPKNILITTTQRIEGKRIRRYFGLIHASIVIESSDRLSVSEIAGHQNQFKDGIAKVMNTLREEADTLGATAIVATSLNFQRIDLHSLLLSAFGTAVQLEDPR